MFLDDEIVKNEAQINQKHVFFETVNNNLANCIKIVKETMWKEGAEEYFHKILQHSYSVEERKYCMDQVHSWSRDFEYVRFKQKHFDNFKSHCFSCWKTRYALGKIFWGMLVPYQNFSA